MVQAASSPDASLRDRLIAISPRERSGPRSSNRFAFQHSWALCFTLQLHERPDDYCVLFDLYDDVVALDHSVAPTKADFYQVKTKGTGNWTLRQLTARKAGTAGRLPSILGKLYDNYVRFPADVRRMAIVSNAHFDIQTASPPPGKDRDSIRLADVEETALQTITNELKAELKLASTPTGLTLTHLDTTALSVSDHEAHATGTVCAFLSRHADGLIPPRPFYKALRAEIQRRSNKECAPSTFEDLLKQKGLTRAHLQALIDSVPSQRQQDDLLSSIRSQLHAENFEFRRAHRLVTSVRTYLAKRQDQTDVLLTHAMNRARQEIASAPASSVSSATPVMDAIARLCSIPATEWQPVLDRYDESFLHAMFTVLIYEQELPTTTAQPQEENS